MNNEIPRPINLSTLSKKMLKSLKKAIKKSRGTYPGIGFKHLQIMSESGDICLYPPSYFKGEDELSYSYWGV